MLQADKGVNVKLPPTLGDISEAGPDDDDAASGVVKAITFCT
jgi:hypothetical protein